MRQLQYCTLCLMFVLVMTGCSRRNFSTIDLDASYASLEIGMSYDEVLEALGEPTTKGTSPMGQRGLTYFNMEEERVLALVFENSKLVLFEIESTN